ncbi:MAG TPA: hypothetical protein VML19_25530, partial [Verrucomicrobiae bacterium]|nr:hypothetical protein [Verrucomicrobiae bacterium]
MSTLFRISSLLFLSILPISVCDAQPRTVKARVAAIDQVIVYNRLGAKQVSGMMFALLRDIVPTASSGQPQDKSCAEQDCVPGKVQLRPSKRPRPIVLRMNVDDTLEVDFTNLLAPTPPATGSSAVTTTRNASFHVTGLQLVKTILSDASFVGANDSSIAPSPDIPSPGRATYIYRAEKPGTYLVTSAAGMLGGTGAGQTSAGLFGAVNVQPAGAIWYRSQVTEADLRAVTTGHTSLGQPTISNYDSVYPAGAVWAGPGNVKIAPNTPILAILNSDNEIVHSDLTAIIVGSKAGPFVDHGEPVFQKNPASPDRTMPWREFTIIYHSDFNATQAFQEMIGCQTCTPAQKTLAIANQAGIDDFAINYGIGGIAAEILANRFGVGPEGKCTECKYEEFFLSSWTVGDPAELVDVPANAGTSRNSAAGQGTMIFQPPVVGQGDPGVNPFRYAANFKAKVAFFPDDPSNVYHSYLNDHVKFQILSADSDLHHIHHQHAHQWLHTPDSDESTYLDSQAIGPGSSFTLEMTYGGSGNRNLTAGDSIFHCHFYPHFAQGMWALWRVHDVFEAGTALQSDGITPTPDSRALPDGEINAGTPIPAVVPIPSMPMPIMPSPVHINNGQVVYGTNDVTGNSVTQNPGYPFFIPGVPGQRAPAPPLDFAVTGGQPMDGGLHRHQASIGTVTQYQTP